MAKKKKPPAPSDDQPYFFEEMRPKPPDPPKPFTGRGRPVTGLRSDHAELWKGTHVEKLFEEVMGCTHEEWLKRRR
ncbi:MAG: hypothetical protein WBF54_15460 [Terriglobales bacterium]